MSKLNDNVKIAIVSAHFIRNLGYQEVRLADSFYKLGYKTKVFTSTAKSNASKNNKLIKDTNEKLYGVLRLKPIVSIGSKVIVKGLLKKISEYNPDFVIVIGAAKLFPNTIFFKKGFNKYKIISVFSDCSEYQKNISLFKKLFFKSSHKIIKKLIYNKVVIKSDRIILNSEDTVRTFTSFIKKKNIQILNNKKKLFKLGFDPDLFFYDPKLRAKKRKEITLNEKDHLIVTCTRVIREKELETVVDVISELILKPKQNLKYIIIGLENDKYSKSFANYVSSQKAKDNIILMPFLNHKEINEYYCASDIGIWSKGAIPIQESMGTGLPIITKDKKTVSHIIKPMSNGIYYNDKNLKLVIEQMLTFKNDKNSIFHIRNRERLVEKNSRDMSYRTIAKNMISNL